MKIAIFTDSFIPLFNGVVTATLNLAEGLADRGHKVYIVAPAYKKLKEFSYPNIKVKRISSMPAFFYEDFKFTSFFSPSLLRYMRKEKIELIHFQTPITLGIQAIILSRILKVPLVGTFHTFFADPQYLKHIRWNSEEVQKVAWAYSNLYYNRCDLITSPSESTKRELIGHSIKAPIKVISNGIDFSQFDNSKKDRVREKYNPESPEGRLLLFVGRVAHEKNILYLIDCFSLVLKRLPKTRLMIVGDGPQRDEVASKARSLGISDRIILMGKIDHEKLMKSSIFGACDLFVTASTTENQPMTVLEAQANGLVCVGISERGMKDLIKDGYNGYLVRLGSKKAFAEKVIRLLSDRKLHEEMAGNTMKEIKKHELGNVISEWEEVYASLIRRARASKDSKL